MFEPRIMAASPLRQPLTFCKRSILLEPGFWTGYWELQSFVGDIFPLNRILNRNLHFQSEIFYWPLNSNLREVNSFLNRTFSNRIWELQSFVGEQISLELDCKPDIWELLWDWLPLSRILNRDPFWWPGTSSLSRDFVTVIYFLSRKFSDSL